MPPTSTEIIQMAKEEWKRTEERKQNHPEAPWVSGWINDFISGMGQQKIPTGMKLAIIVRKDLGMRTGKIAVQVAHASVIAYSSVAGTDIGKTWFEGGQKKIVLKVASERELGMIGEKAILNHLQVNSVWDFGLTQIEPNTITCIAIGPDEDEKIDEITKGLSLL